jgi:hypothetical protein
VRQCYVLLLNTIQTLLNDAWHGVLVKGVAGVGKVRHHRPNGMESASVCCLIPRLIPLVVVVLCLCVPGPVAVRCVGDATLPLTRVARRV